MITKGEQQTASPVGYRINTSKVIAETIDGEAVLVNFDTGDYFSLDGVGAEIWDLIGSRATVEETVEALSARYDADR